MTLTICTLSTPAFVAAPSPRPKGLQHIHVKNTRSVLWRDISLRANMSFMPEVLLEPPEVVPASFIYSKELLFPGPPETGLQGAG